MAYLTLPPWKGVWVVSCLGLLQLMMYGDICDICVQRCVARKFSFLCDKCLTVSLLNCMLSVYLVYKKLANQFPGVVSFYTP